MDVEQSNELEELRQENAQLKKRNLDLLCACLWFLNRTRGVLKSPALRFLFGFLWQGRMLRSVAASEIFGAVESEDKDQEGTIFRAIKNAWETA